MPYYRRNIVVLWISTLVAASAWQQIVPFLPLFLTELGVTGDLHTWSGFIYSIHYISALVCLPFWGCWADRKGHKRLMLRAGLCLAGLYVAMSFAVNPIQVAVIRLASGALTGFVPGAIALAVANTPSRLTGKYVAALQTANAAGLVFGPISGGILADWLGYRGTLQVTGVMLFSVTLLVWVMVREQTPKPIPGAKLANPVNDLVVLCRQPMFLASMLVVALSAIATLSAQPILGLHLDNLHAPQVFWLRGVLIALPGIAVILTASFWEHLGEKHSQTKIIYLSLLGAGFTAVLISISKSVEGFASMYLFLGVCAAALRPCASALVAVSLSNEFHGRAYAMQQWAWLLGGLAGPLLAGLVGTVAGTYAVFLCTGIILLAGAVLLQRLVISSDNPVATNHRSQI